MKLCVFLLIFTLNISYGALYFDGSDDQIVVPHSVSLNTTPFFTVEFWCFMTDTGYQIVDAVAKGTTHDNCVYRARWEKPRLDPPYNGSVSFGAHYHNWTLPDSMWSYLEKWVHWAFTDDGSLLSVYINGALLRTEENANTTTNTEDVHFGKNQYTGEVSMDEIRIWDIARTQKQIQENKDRRIAPQSGLVGLWRLDEQTGSKTKDLTANENHGTKVGASPIAGAPIKQYPGRRGNR